MKKKIFFMLGLFLLIVGSVVYLSMSTETNEQLASRIGGADEKNASLVTEQEEETQKSKGYSRIDDAPQLEAEVEDEAMEEEKKSRDRETKETLESTTQSSSEKSIQEKEMNDKKKERKDKEMTNQGTELSSLGNAYEIQDNTFVDKWGVVIKIDRLPEALKGAEGYTVSIGEKSYELHLNKYNSNVFNTQVSSIEHTKEDIEKAILTTN